VRFSPSDLVVRYTLRLFEPEGGTLHANDILYCKLYRINLDLPFACRVDS
jgi:hypothetical protein